MDVPHSSSAADLRERALPTLIEFSREVLGYLATSVLRRYAARSAGPRRLAASVLAAHLESFPARKVTLPWRDLDGKPRTETLIFPTGRGTAMHRTWFNSDVWRPAREAAGLANVRENGMHALRHCYASVLLAGGVDIRALSEYLGHHDPAFTLRIYAHLMPGADERARRAVEAALAAVDDGPVTAPAGEQRP